jgi:hypothetical protein
MSGAAAKGSRNPWRDDVSSDSVVIVPPGCHGGDTAGAAAVNDAERPPEREVDIEEIERLAAIAREMELE